MSYKVRFANEKDIPEIIELLKQVCKVHHDGRPDLFKLTTKYNEDELKEIINNPETPVFVCEDGRILGHGFCVLQRAENTRLLTDILTLYIDDICVDESARGLRTHHPVCTREGMLQYHPECMELQSGCDEILR